MNYVATTFFAGIIAVLILACCQPKPNSIPDLKINQIHCPNGATLEYVRESPMSLSAERKLCDVLEPTPNL